jgi:hypothetical protein
MSFSGSEIRKDNKRLEVDIQALSAKYHGLMQERNVLAGENERLKKNSNDYQNQHQKEPNQALQELQPNQNQNQVEAKTQELDKITLGIQTAEASQKQSIIKANKGKALVGGGILSSLGLGYIEPFIDQIKELKFIANYQFKVTHLIILAVLLIGTYIMFKNKIDSEINKVLGN